MATNWTRALADGTYVSADGRYTAELRRPGKYDGVKLLRHYAVRLRGGSAAVIGTARTLAEAHRMYVA